MQICTLTHTHNHASIPPLGQMPFLPPNQQHQSTEGNYNHIGKLTHSDKAALAVAAN